MSCPEELFDLSFFQEDPRPFYQFARRLYFPTGVRNKPVHPSDAHRLLALLDQQGVLLRVYSQNIDGLEAAAGVSPQKICHAHGSLQWAVCQRCKRKVDWSVMQDDIWHGRVARCTAKIETKSKKKHETAATNKKRSDEWKHYQNQNNNFASNNGIRVSSRKRSRDEEKNPNKMTMRTRGVADKESRCGGVLKPGVTFFGEALDDKVRRYLEADRNKVDALIVMGTSLSVAPISKAISYFPPDIPRILVNRCIVHPAESALVANDEISNDEEEEKDFREDYVFDAYLLGFCDDVTRALGKAMFPSKTMALEELDASQEQKSSSTESCSCNVESGWDWSGINVPNDRVFLFPGAQASAQADDASDITYREVAHCDGCSNRIEGQIRKCMMCFDFDLCSECYPLMSKKHFEGKHRFSVEDAIVTGVPLLVSRPFPNSV